ncbi:MAG: PTS sugar transporter subunit IIA [Alkalispirochaeta sp.]
MNLKKILSPSVIFPSIEVTTKEDAIESMVKLLAAARDAGPIEPLLEVVMERERKDSTGLEQGIAVPHGKTDAVTDLIAGIGRLVEPVEWGTRDGSLVRILVMTISPLKRTGPHLQFIGEVVRLLREERHRTSLLSASGASEMYDVMTQ